MDIRQLTPRYFVAPQIDPQDLAALKSEGFECILCNRPDGEVPPSHGSDAMRDAAQAAGLRFEYLPLTHQTMTLPVIDENRALGADTEQKVLSYCASGTRSCIAWALGQRNTMEHDQIVDAARAAGYDIGHLRPVLQAASGS